MEKQVRYRVKNAGQQGKIVGVRKVTRSIEKGTGERDSILSICTHAHISIMEIMK